jgi:hypothetical protein
MRPKCYLASGNKSILGSQVLEVLSPLVKAAEEIFKSQWPDIYKIYTEFHLEPHQRIGTWPQAQFLKNISVDWHKDTCNWHSGIQISLIFGHFTGGSLELETGQVVKFSGKEDECSYCIFNPWEVRHRVHLFQGTRYALQLFAHKEVVNVIRCNT